MSLRIIDWPAFLSGLSPAASAATIGVFDGVHLGHQKLIGSIVRRGPNPTVITFRENPKKFVSAASYPGDLFSLKQKLEVFERLGVSQAVLIDFSEEFSKLKGKEFIELLGASGKVSFLTVGSNFRCGYKQDTGPELIRELCERKGISTELIPPVVLPGEGPVSSSRIRQAVVSGDISTAAALMGRDFKLDLSDLKPETVIREKRKAFLYDPRSRQRIIPAAGRYDVLADSKIGSLEAENGKILLFVDSDRPLPTSLRFL